MGENKKTKKHLSKSKIILVAFGFVLALSYIAVLSYLKFQKDSARVIKANIIEFKGIPENIDIKATLKNKSGVYDLEFKNSALVLSQKAIDNFTVPYEIKSRWQNKEGDYHDIMWELDKDGVFYTVTLDGFSPFDSVSLSFENSYSIKSAKMDWAGKIELPIVLNSNKNLQVCVDIAASHPFNFCHLVIGKKDGEQS